MPNTTTSGAGCGWSAHTRWPSNRRTVSTSWSTNQGSNNATWPGSSGNQYSTTGAFPTQGLLRERHPGLRWLYHLRGHREVFMSVVSPVRKYSSSGGPSWHGPRVVPGDHCAVRLPDGVRHGGQARGLPVRWLAAGEHVFRGHGGFPGVYLAYSRIPWEGDAPGPLLR